MTRTKTGFRLLVCANFTTLVISLAGCSGGAGGDNKAKLPYGWFDLPADNATVTGTVNAQGWALCEDGVEKVAVYIDRSFVTYGTMSGPRPDVVKVYPEYASVADIGYSARFEAGALSVGRHEVLLRAISKKGAVRDLGVHVINVTH
jgi:hypothetical protein